MTDPKRLLDDTGGLTSEQCQVLAADAQFNAPPEARAMVWSSLTAALGTATVATALSSAGGVAAKAGLGAQAAGSGASVGHALGLGAIVKLTVVGAAIGTSIATANHFWSTRDVTAPKQVAAAAHSSVARGAPAVSAVAAQPVAITNTSRRTPTRTVDEQVTSATVTLSPTSEPINTPPSEPAAAAGDGTAPAQVSGANGRALSAAAAKPNRTSSDAREESQIIASARSLLRTGNAAAALQLLDRASSRFPDGILVQEREALRIEALSALGRTSDARALADAFMRAYPNSPHVSRVKGR